jgi:hypothetical protein
VALTIPSQQLPDPPQWAQFSVPPNLQGGYFQITGNPARIEIAYGAYGFGQTLPQVVLPPGSYSVGRSPDGRPLAGIRAQNAGAGLGAVFGGYFWTATDPTLSFIGVPSSQQVGSVNIPVVALADFPPVAPANGDIIILDVPASFNPITGRKVHWLCTYDATSSGWHVSGPPIGAVVTTAQNSTSTSYTDLGTVGPSLTLPRPGDYLITLSLILANVSGASDEHTGYMSFDGWGLLPNDDRAASTRLLENGSMKSAVHVALLTGLPATTATAKYRTNVALNTSYRNRRFLAQPVFIT